MSGPRWASGAAAAVAAGATMILAPACSGGGQSPAAQSGLAALPAAQILSRAQAAVKAAGSLHFASMSKEGSTSIVFSDDSTAGGGRQDITMSNGGQMTVLVVSGTGYVNGNAAALNGFLGLPTATADQMAGRWVSVPSGSPEYQQVVSGVTAGSVLSEFTPAGALTATGPQVVDGRSVVGVRGTAPASSGLPRNSALTLYIAATGRPLPVSAAESGGGDQTKVTFSGWGEQVSVQTPAQSTPVPEPTPSTPPGPPGLV